MGLTSHVTEKCKQVGQTAIVGNKESYVNYKYMHDEKYPEGAVHTVDIYQQLYVYVAQVKRGRSGRVTCSVRDLVNCFYEDIQRKLGRMGGDIYIAVADNASNVPRIKEKEQKRRRADKERSGIAPIGGPESVYLIESTLTVVDKSGNPEDQEGTMLQQIDPEAFFATPHLRDAFLRVCRDQFPKIQRAKGVLTRPSQCVIFDFQGVGHKAGERESAPVAYSLAGRQELKEHAHGFGEGELAQCYWAHVYRDRNVFIRTVDSDILPISMSLVDQQLAAQKEGKEVKHGDLVWVYKDRKANALVKVDLRLLHKNFKAYFDLKLAKQFSRKPEQRDPSKESFATAFSLFCAFFGTDYVTKFDLVEKRTPLKKINDSIEACLSQITDARKWRPDEILSAAEAPAVVQGSAASAAATPVKGRGVKRSSPDSSNTPGSSGYKVIEEIAKRVNRGLSPMAESADTQQAVHRMAWQVQYWQPDWYTEASASAPRQTH